MANTSIVTAYNMFADRKEKKEIVGLLVFNIVPDYVVYSFFNVNLRTRTKTKK